MILINIGIILNIILGLILIRALKFIFNCLNRAEKIIEYYEEQTNVQLNNSFEVARKNGKSILMSEVEEPELRRTFETLSDRKKCQKK